jgi:hypothetical protein
MNKMYKIRSFFLFFVISFSCFAQQKTDSTSYEYAIVTHRQLRPIYIQYSNGLRENFNELKKIRTGGSMVNDSLRATVTFSFFEYLNRKTTSL